MTTLAFISRFLLGAIFILSGGTKIGTPTELGATLVRYALLPAWSLRIAARVSPTLAPPSS
ncbi:MAG: hypothetical protein M0Z42_15400 [Actinomycetota bacterium]|jgi:hypothetical protein|nr:hypothetical protein [Actinomycetota bacterium]